MVRHTLKNLTAFAARFLKCVSDHFGTLCIKGLNQFLIKNASQISGFEFGRKAQSP